MVLGMASEGFGRMMSNPKRRELWERDENGDTAAMQLIKVANRLHLEENPPADVQCPECQCFMKPEVLQRHFEQCRLTALDGG
jgi:hypothetical protein